MFRFPSDAGYQAFFLLRLTFMMAVGVVEIIAGLGVLFKPKFFAYVVSLWLLGIVINLLMTGHYFDIALRDIGLCLSSLALGRLSQKYAI